MGRLFGTDGVRGIAGEKLSCELAFKLGQASALVLTIETHNPKILIGKDTRISGDMLESAIIAGICSAGATAVCLGVIPTSAVAYLTRKCGADAGIVISASHNSAEYNGIKIFNSKGYKLADSLEDRIQEIVLGGKTLDLPTGIGVGTRNVFSEAAEEYSRFLMSTTDQKFDGIKVVLDCANGASSAIAPNIFRKMGAEVYEMFNTPDGVNINENCGSTHIGNLQRKVVELGADIGLAFDGDADRVLAADENGNLMDGDMIMAVCALDLKERGMLKNNVLTGTIMSNLGLELGMRKYGIELAKTKVGDRYVLEEMLKNGYSLGGEQSGHIIFLDYNTTGDGILTGIQLLSILKRSGKKASNLADVIEILPQVLINAKVKEKNKSEFDKDDEIVKKIKEVEIKMNGKGRVLIRPSGTEPLVRVMIEGENKAEIEKDAADLVKLIESKLG